MGIFFGGAPNMVTHMLQRAWGQGAVCTTGRVRGGALLSKDAKSCVSPPNDSKAESIRWIAKSSTHRGGVGTVGKVTRRDDLSGLLVAVLDNQPTDKRTHQSEFSTRGLRSARILPASGIQVINHSSPLPVACGHAAPPSWSH